MEKDADFESHGIEADSQPVSKNRRKRKKDPLKISEEEALRRLERDLARAKARIKGELGGDEDLEGDDVDESGEEEKSVAKKPDAEGEATSGGEILVERARSKVYTIKELSRHIKDLAHSLYGEELGEQEEWLAKNRPRKRGECPEFRPCPFLSCRHHLYLDVTRNKRIRFNFPNVDPTEMSFSCSLDIAERGGCTLDEVAAFLSVTRERVRQLEVLAVDRLKKTIHDSSRRLPGGGYLKWEDVEEYDEDDECDGDGNGGDMDGLEGTEGVDVLGGGDGSSNSGTVVENSEVDCVPSTTPALDFSLDDEE